MHPCLSVLKAILNIFEAGGSLLDVQPNPDRPKHEDHCETRQKLPKKNSKKADVLVCLVGAVSMEVETFHRGKQQHCKHKFLKNCVLHLFLLKVKLGSTQKEAVCELEYKALPSKHEHIDQ